MGINKYITNLLNPGGLEIITQVGDADTKSNNWGLKDSAKGKSNLKWEMRDERWVSDEWWAMSDDSDTR